MAWMSDEKYSFIQDCKEKKSIGASTFKARTHCGKGGRVKFPSDYLSKKELKAMNGDCKSYRLNAPMSWEEFKSMPDDLKTVYIKALREKYNVPNNAIAEMFGVSAPVVSNYLKCLGLAEGKGASAGKRFWNKEGFLAWRTGADSEAVKPSEDIVEETVEEATPEVREEVVEATLNVIGEAAATVLEEMDSGSATDEDIKETVEYDYSLGVPEELVGKEIDTYPNGFEIPCAGPIAFAGNPVPVIPKSGSMSFENNWSEDILTTLRTLLSGVRVNMHISWEVVNEEK